MGIPQPDREEGTDRAGGGLFFTLSLEGEGRGEGEKGAPSLRFFHRHAHCCQRGACRFEYLFTLFNRQC
ncbi:hypothetical protein MRY16398_06830 [Phytobacter sp. MRY16-398]|nr:hypothetical protein MRY16398_06830 [Phytobacter sp. MRY16-398]